MKLINPRVEYWDNKDSINHVARCARICYKSDNQNNNEELFQRLLNSAHHSMFRHDTKYYIVPNIKGNISSDLRCLYDVLKQFEANPYIHQIVTESNIFVSANGQFVLNHQDEFLIESLSEFVVDKETFFSYNETKLIRRFTFCITSQISTTRELNRVSPNNIAEESTRYCNYSKNKFGNEISICKPHWYDNANATLQGIYSVICKKAESGYFRLLDEGMLPQDARGVLPLDTASTVVYTYTIKEWKHIIDLRYRGVTGAPHPNAKIVIGEVYKQLTKMGYDV